MTSGTESQQNVWEFARSKSLAVTLLLALGVGIAVVVGQGDKYHAAAGFLWSLGFTAAGVLLGFIFAVPRPSRASDFIAPATSAPNAGGAASGNAADTASTAAKAPAPPTPAARAASMEINNNLTEISDWLTKIIVGVGLVELKGLPAHAESVARFMAPSLHDSPLGVPLAGAIILYFSVLGFLGGYLLTRIYISQLISRADTLTRSGGQVQLESGKLVDVDELTRMQQPVIEDLQAQVASLVGASGGTGAAAAAAAPEGAMSAAAPPVPPLRVLWADDRPHSITLQVNMLENEGHHVDTAVDIDQALAALKSRRYDLLITDMHRVERGEDRPTAGLDLLRAAKQQAGDLPVMIFCGKKRAEQFAEEARSSGAALITSSSTALLAAVRDIAKARAGSS